MKNLLNLELLDLSELEGVVMAADECGSCGAGLFCWGSGTKKKDTEEVVA